MVTQQIPLPFRVWKVRTKIADEHEGDILSTTDDHFEVVATGRDDLKRLGRREGRQLLVRGDAQIRYPREDGSIGSLYPDILVAYGVTVAGHKPYEFNRVGKPPELLIEILSNETARNDIDDIKGKLRVYAEMGVFEYLTFDPRLRKKLEMHGYRLAQVGTYAEIPTSPEGGVWLESVGLLVVPEPADRGAERGPLLRFFGADGQPIPHRWEDVEARERAEQALERAEQARQQEELKRRQAERASSQERRARLEAEQAREQAERERATIAAELARLRAQFGLAENESDDQGS